MQKHEWLPAFYQHNLSLFLNIPHHFTKNYILPALHRWEKSKAKWVVPSSPKQIQTPTRNVVLMLYALEYNTQPSLHPKEWPRHKSKQKPQLCSQQQFAVSRLKVRLGLKALNPLHAEVSLRHTLSITYKINAHKYTVNLNTILI